MGAMAKKKKNVRECAFQSQDTPIPQLLGLPAANGSEVHPSLGIVFSFWQLPHPGLCLSQDVAWDKRLADPGIQRPSQYLLLFGTLWGSSHSRAPCKGEWGLGSSHVVCQLSPCPTLPSFFLIGVCSISTLWETPACHCLSQSLVPENII